ncbi:hypothetical protein STAFG_2602 [Streptomyces afghaniensis 772]|uniref:Uncharacterized protein n=1 Tax=Streptomyces afghaniensis 772 TaxID=1283301 RepID=S4MLE5_9ACTN|nr:hypothetical protein [Streptomyces afghaniensis]EPJ40353.1 hypothetical protein STAFG_2602 [Streptomyces afghaniensis 772]
MREFSSLFADLGEGLDDLGVPEGQPFLISPAGGYDVALNRYFSVSLASSPWNTQAAHARDLRTYFDFLWFARGRRDWRDASMDDRAAFEWWRRRDERGPRWEDTSWDRADRALCRTSEGPADQPVMADCKPLVCRNTALTPANLQALTGHFARLEDALADSDRLAPYVRHRLGERHRATAAFLTCHAPEIAE